MKQYEQRFDHQIGSQYKINSNSSLLFAMKDVSEFNLQWQTFYMVRFRFTRLRIELFLTHIEFQCFD